MAKRVTDAVLAAVGLAFLAPVLCLISIALLLLDRGPIFYGSRRVGLNGQVFRMWKFRSMVVNADQLGGSSVSDDDSRLTSFGRWLRAHKLDELPQLWNVLIGDMSLVGPRPQVSWLVDRYVQEERILLTVRPGITDPASLRFRNLGQILVGHENPDMAYLELIHPEKMRLSVDYVKNRTFWGDVNILVSTIRAAFRDATQPGKPGQDIPNP